MGVNKVVINGIDGEEVLIDLTQDTVTPETLEEGITAHNASGEQIVGSREPLGQAAYADISNTLTTTEEGFVLDARQGKQLYDQILALNSIIENLTKTETLRGGDSVVVFQKVNTYVMVYISKMPALSPGQTIELGKSTLIKNTANIITVGSYGGTGVMFDLFLKITMDGVVTLTNMTDKSIAAVYYKGSCILA